MSKGIEGFNDFYQVAFGSRWPDLKTSLMKQTQKIARSSIYVPFDSAMGDAFPEIELLKNCKNTEAISDLNQIENSSGLRHFYVMDPASVIVARLLPLKEQSIILDMCAAPGGKSLILAERMDEGSELICNEFSRDRRDRLTRVIQDYIPKDKRQSVSVKGKDGLQYGMILPNHFDSILLDAPCSSEHHVMHDQKEIEHWNLKRTKGLAGKQYGLICSALLALKSEGYVMYSTCALSPLENDGVLEKLSSKKGDSFKFVEIENLPSFVEKTKFGYHILPDKIGFGPMFFSLIKKN